jgi:RimJ/RimL family protein N-acetyltransferase
VELELRSERFLLRPCAPRDVDFYVELRNHPEMLALPGRQPRSRSDIELQLQRWIERWQRYGFGAWTVFDREVGSRLGRVEFDPMDSGWQGIGAGEIELGYIVHPTRWNRGTATDATALAVADFFGRTDRDRLVALTTPDNQASLRTLAKLGARPCGETQHESDEMTYVLFELLRPPPAV